MRPLALVLLVVTTGLAAARKVKETKAPSPDAARVAILLYDDKTGTKNFEYMPGSLKEAITNSMHEKFEFNEVDLVKVDPVVNQVKTKSKGKIAAKEAAEICRQADIDILIYGDFTFNKEANEIEIHTNISLGSTDKFRLLPAVENRVDSTIFQAADKVATDIVAEITKVALEQQQAKGKTAETDKKGKTQLDKTEKSKTWADINWSFALSAGPIYPLISRDNVKIQLDPALSLNSQYRFRNNWHIGLFVSAGGLRTSSNNSPYSTRFDHIAAAPTIGYFFDLSPRWRLTNALGAGYFAGEIVTESYCASGNTSCTATPSTTEKVRNPFFLARSGIHFMIFSFLAVGLDAEWRMYYDSKPVQTVGAALAITGMF